MPISAALARTQAWELGSMREQAKVKHLMGGAATRYPTKMLRYWFVHNLIREQAQRLGRPVRICEIGVDRGQLPHFVRDAGFADVATWDAVDYRLRPELGDARYTRQIQADVDQPDFRLDQTYDVIIVLHLLEHLFEPEVLTDKLVSSLAADGILIGGFPVTPDTFQPWWQRRLRRRIDRSEANFGHVSVFSTLRVRRMAHAAGLKPEFISGAFLLRKTGAFIENFHFWTRLNLMWGALFPSLGGELYWCLRRPTR